LLAFKVLRVKVMADLVVIEAQDQEAAVKRRNLVRVHMSDASARVNKI
jgi:hypothetical protein